MSKLQRVKVATGVVSFGSFIGIVLTTIACWIIAGETREIMRCQQRIRELMEGSSSGTPLPREDEDAGNAWMSSRIGS